MPRKKNPYDNPWVKPDYHSQNKQLKNEENEDDALQAKRSVKLRSSLDIYHRLMHDATLGVDLNQVMIGYTDMFGDQEICILEWTLIDKGGDIPMHHIEYFAFILNNGNKLILWDRRTKLDRLYGSGVTRPEQRLDDILRSAAIQRIQSGSTPTLGPIVNKTAADDDEKKQDNDINTQTAVYDHSLTLTTTLHKNDMITKFFPRYPTTDDGFVQSFNINDTQQWLKCLNHYGLVVLKVLSDAEVDKTVQSMFDELYCRASELHASQAHTGSPQQNIQRVEVDNPVTWLNHNWPNPKKRFLTKRPAFSKQAFVNRCSTKMYFIFKTIYNHAKLNVSIDNYGISRGTKNLKNVDPKMAEKWRHCLEPHWDINPWKYIHWLKCGHYSYIYQGALALSEQRIVDGTHLTLPGCMNFLPKWCELNEKENRNPHRHTLAADDKLKKYMQAIPLRKGEMVIWNYGQLHANTKNFSPRMRLSQYIRMYPSQQKYIKRDHYSAQAILQQYKRDIDMTKILRDELNNELTFKLLGMKQW
mmetsp:Transcript_8689/g.13408  ORF Transcript_8689/g.13408 Transcript_8689/m.13408 type:complete len:529 (+) Transcript_8689:66-1652(+)|eukprot:CAMPEP_0202705028 /NCGR_PEP_ID=MMETSP1385-20130828/17621_1 /ASSEMBLY_ACC=CAM_ASM_000861 /TAXON_ID=933848 /ORGANISM="Elphidium margaritaceum" /LENGTH=528 /DNA_ID=CAMNT_0049363173 /DNA_START=63 /DNA_END=1649 /DNA_ORIENTATION=-